MIHNKTFRKAWKKFWNPILGSGLVQWTVALILAIPMWLVYFTSRNEIVGLETFKKYSKKPAVFVFWHGRMMMLSPMICMRGMRAYVIASRHKDGRMMAKVQKLFGLKAIYGSTTKGGVEVLRQGVRVLRDGRYALCLTPDGPSGPSMRIKDGVLYFAKMTGAPIIPVCFSASRAHLQNRWDRCLIAKPFSRIKYIIGKPMFIAPNATSQDLEDVRKKLENIMVTQVRELDSEFGLMTVEQDLKSGQFKRDMREARKNKKIKKAGK